MSHTFSLNPPQLDAVRSVQGPLSILAGAGTGKTRVITNRIVHLLNEGVPANRILAVTFTNKAAKEMKERVGGMSNESDSRGITISTFTLCASGFYARRFTGWGTSPTFPSTTKMTGAGRGQESLKRPVMSSMTPCLRVTKTL